jgi:hypothetical protein
MVKIPSFKRLILRAVLRQASPMVIRVVSVSDEMPLHEFHDVFRTILRWNSDLGLQSFVCTVRKLIASGGRRGRKPCTCGSGTFGSWIFRRGSKATTRRSVWVAAALRPRNFGAIADMSDLSRAFIVPMLCFGFIAFFGFM